MTNVFEFPTIEVRDWVIIERSLNENLAGLNASKKAHSRLHETMKTFWHMLAEFNIKLSIPLELETELDKEAFNKACSTISTQLSDGISIQQQAFTRKLFIERLLREIDICKELGIFYE